MYSISRSLLRVLTIHLFIFNLRLVLRKQFKENVFFCKEIINTDKGKNSIRIKSLLNLINDELEATDDRIKTHLSVFLSMFLVFRYVNIIIYYLMH